MKHILLILLLCVLAATALAQDGPVFNADTAGVLIRNRTDIEILADQQFGTGVRVAGWSGSLDINNPQLTILIRQDLELLLAHSVGIDNIPPGWFGAQTTTIDAIARDIRHDLELLADTLLGLSVRPPGWSGDDPLMRCDRSTQNLVTLLVRQELFTPNILPGNSNYCQTLTTQVSQYTEMTLLTQPTVPDLQPETPEQSSSTGSGGSSTSGDTFFALDNITLAFLDRYATRYIGAIPPGIPFTPVARSFYQFSHMTVVRGEGFEVLVDYATTTMNENQFSRLPDLNLTATNPHCDADWCRPERRIAPVELRTRNRTNSQGFVTAGLVSATDNIVIYYDEGDQNGMAKVRMLLCDRPTSTNQAICEPVIDVILPDGTVAVPVGVVDGIEQFFVPYTYSTTSVHSANFHTADLWVAPPDDR